MSDFVLPISGEMSVGAALNGEVSIGSVIFNDYIITISDINGGHRLTARRGSDIQTMDILNGVDAPVPDIKITDVEHGHDVTITVGDVAKTFYIHDGVDAPVPEIYIETVQGGHKVIAAVGDTVKSFTVKDGVDGEDGDDAPIPEIKVETISGGHKVTASVGNKVQSFNVMDGKDGKTPVKNVDYFDGKDGVSPVVKVTDIENGHHVTITTGSDVQSFDVLNGKDGEDAEGGTVEVDHTLSIEGMAADAKATGDAIKAIGSGGTAQVQSDYNQHDATQPDYIRNRPCWPELSPVLVCTDDYGHYGTNDNGRTRIEINFDSVPGVVAPMEGKRYTFGFAAQTYSGIATRGVYAWGDNLQLDGIGIVAEQDAGVYAFYRGLTDENRKWYVVLPESDYDHADNFELFAIIEGNGFYNKLSAADDKLDMTGVPEGVSIVYDLTKLYNAANSGDVKSGNMYAALQNDVEITVDMNGAEITLTSADLVFAPNQNMMGFECDLYIYGGQVPLAGIVHDGDYRSLALLDLSALGMASITTKAIKVNYPGIFAPVVPAKKVPVECLPGALVVYTPVLGQAFAFADYEGTINITCADIRTALRSGCPIYVRVVADIDVESAAKGYGEYYSVMRIEFFKTSTGIDSAMLMYEHKSGTRSYCEARD